MNVTLEALLQRLIARGTAKTISTSTGDDRQPTSIRLRPSTRHFVECQAEALGISVQGVIGMILDGVAEATLDRTASGLRTMRERFFYLFEAHSIDMPGIVSILKPFGCRLSQLSSGDALLDLLTNDLLRYLGDLFHIEPSWLSGASDTITTSEAAHGRWYKNQGSACRRLAKYSSEGLGPAVCFIRRLGADFQQARANDDKGRREPIGIIVRLQRKADDGTTFRTYELWEFERWNYWRCRFHIKHIIAFCEAFVKRTSWAPDHHLTYVGYELPEDSIQKVCSGQVLPVTVLSGPHQIWRPDDYAGVQWQGSHETDEWSFVEEDFGGREAFNQFVEEIAAPAWTEKADD